MRNPHFRVWSAAAKPDGYPDVIVHTTGGSVAPALRAVEEGSEDYVNVAGSVSELSKRELDELFTRYAEPGAHQLPADDGLLLAEHARAAVRRPRRATGAQLRRRSPRGAGVRGGRSLRLADLSDPPAELPRLPTVLPVHGRRGTRPAMDRSRPPSRAKPDRPLRHPGDARHRPRNLAGLHRPQQVPRAPAEAAGLPGLAPAGLREADRRHRDGPTPPSADRPPDLDRRLRGRRGLRRPALQLRRARLR